MMRFLRKGAVILIIAAMLCSASVADASSAVSVTTSDGANISFKNSSGGEVEKSIVEIITDTAQSKKISKVITVRSENTELIPTDIYIRVSADKKSTTEKFDIEITDSTGTVVEADKVSEIDGEQGKVYIKDIYLGCFNLKIANESRIYTLIADINDDVELSIISDPRRNGQSSQEGIRTVKKVGNGIGKIKPGEYYLNTSKQVKISSAAGEVKLFKASGTSVQSELVYLDEGDTIEYYGTVYLKDTAENIKYLPFHFNSILQLAPGYYTGISEGKIVVYDEDGIPRILKPAAFNENAYLLNCGTLKKDSAEIGNDGERIRLQSGKLYTVGAELTSGKYIGTGEGLVRVYDSAGYAKTVIKLKRENSSADGVAEYVFKLTENETLIIDGNIEFQEVNTSLDN